MENEKKKRVLVAMSGGVDSSAAVKLLLEQGYECAGATMHLYNNEDIGLERTAGLAVRSTTSRTRGSSLSSWG